MNVHMLLKLLDAYGDPANNASRNNPEFVQTLLREAAKTIRSRIDDDAEPPPIRTPEDFVRVLGNAVEADLVPGIFGLDDLGKSDLHDGRGTLHHVALLDDEEKRGDPQNNVGNRILRVTVSAWTEPS